MADPSGMLKEFHNYLNLVVADGRKPNAEDVNYFVENFLKSGRRQFFFKRQLIKSAEHTDPITKEKMYDKSKKSYQELVEEITPILQARVIEAYGEVQEGYGPYKFNTAPMTVDEYADYYAGESGKKAFDKLTGSDRRNHPAYQKAVKEVSKIKFRIKEYMRVVMPFTARLTMYHNLAAVTYDTAKGPLPLQRKDNKGDPFVIDSEEKLYKFIESPTVDGFPAVEHSGLRSIFWEPTESGKNIKMGVIDIDNPARLSHSELTSYVKKIYRRITSDLEHPSIIMYTGESFQIWFGQNGNELILNHTEMKDYLRTTLSDLGAFSRDEAINIKAPFLNLDVNKPKGLIRAFFSLHYPPRPGATKPYTGRAAVPIPFGHLDKFNPEVDAHPESVLVNFDTYSSMVASFYDQVQIGQDYESPGEIEVQPSCSRLEKKFPNAAVLKAIYKESDLNVVEYRNVGAVLEGEEKVYAHPVARGVLAVLVYDPKGETIPEGMTAKRLVKGKVTIRRPHSYYILSNGTVIYDDYICRDFERSCVAKKIRQAVLVGRVSLFDTFGNEETEQSTMNELIRSEGILPTKARIMKFTINRAPIVNSQKVPPSVMGEQIKQFASKRVIPSPYFEFEAPVGIKLKQKFMDLVRSKMSGALMVEGEEKYLIKSTRTIFATIVGMDITGKAYKSGTDLPPVIVALGRKSTKHGVEYLTVAKAQIALKKEDRLTLRQILEGEEGKNLIPAPRGPAKDQIIFTEPSVVVEVSYDDITPQTMVTGTFHFDRDGNFRRTTTDPATNKLINARVTAIRQDLDHRRHTHISYRQDEMIELSTRPTTADFDLIPLPNPGAFFGVPQTLEIYLGGVPDLREDTLPDGSKVIREYRKGGRKFNLALVGNTKGRYLGERLPAELEKSWERYDKGLPGHKTFVDLYSAAPGETPHYRITNLGFEYNTAIDDRYGKGQEANAIESMGGVISKSENYLETMEHKHLFGNRQQAIEDTKVFQSTFQEIPGNVDAEIETRGFYDADYKAAYKKADVELKKTLTPTKVEFADHPEIIEAVMSNPRPIKDDLWQTRVDLYIEEFNKWAALPEPKEDWEKYAMGLFLTWEMPILEKDRLMRQAQQSYELTEEEASRVDLEYAGSQSDNMFDLILSDLYEVPEDDETAQEAIQ